MKAAVFREINTPMEVEEVTIDNPDRTRSGCVRRRPAFATPTCISTTAPIPATDR